MLVNNFDASGHGINILTLMAMMLSSIDSPELLIHPKPYFESFHAPYFYLLRSVAVSRNLGGYARACSHAAELHSSEPTSALLKNAGLTTLPP